MAVRVAALSRATAMAAATALGCALALAPTTPAHALGVDVSCTGTFEIAFSPSLTDVSQGTVTNTDHASYATCVTGQPGSSASTHPEPGETCVDLLTRLTPYTEVITWQDGTKSTIAWTSVEATLSGATATGTVMSGHYLGDSATKVVDALSFTGTNPELCPLGDGTVSGVSGTVALTIESL